VLVTLFNTRLKLLSIHQENRQETEPAEVIGDIRKLIALIPIESYSVRRIYTDVEAAWQDSFWQHLSDNDIDFLQMKVGPLLRFALCNDVQEATFTSKIERLKWQVLAGKNTESTALSILEDVSRLPEFVKEEPKANEAITLCLSEELKSASVEKLDMVRDTLAKQMKNRREKPNAFIALDLPDLIEKRGYVFLKGGSERIYVKEYRQRIEEEILKFVDTHPVLNAILHGDEVSGEQLIDLERAMQKQFSEDGLEITPENVRIAYSITANSLLELLQQLLELDIPDYRTIVQKQFDTFASLHPFNADQLRFLRALQSVLVQQHKIERPDLYDAPALVSFGDNFIDRHFSEAQINEILTFVEAIAA